MTVSLDPGVVELALRSYNNDDLGFWKWMGTVCTGVVFDDAVDQNARLNFFRHTSSVVQCKLSEPYKLLILTEADCEPVVNVSRGICELKCGLRGFNQTMESVVLCNAKQSWSVAMGDLERLCERVVFKNLEIVVTGNWLLQRVVKSVPTQGSIDTVDVNEVLEDMAGGEDSAGDFGGDMVRYIRGWEGVVEDYEFVWKALLRSSVTHRVIVRFVAGKNVKSGEDMSLGLSREAEEVFKKLLSVRLRRVLGSECEVKVRVDWLDCKLKPDLKEVNKKRMLSFGPWLLIGENAWSTMCSNNLTADVHGFCTMKFEEMWLKYQGVIV